jgi:hypothetical protein
MSKDPTRIQRQSPKKIRQISPAKRDRLHTYFTETVKGEVKREVVQGITFWVYRAMGHSPIRLRGS